MDLRIVIGDVLYRPRAKNGRYLKVINAWEQVRIISWFMLGLVVGWLATSITYVMFMVGK